MRAAVIYEHGGPGSIKYETAFPDPVAKPDEVILKVGAATLNYHDVFTRNGMPGITVPMPIIMGLDFAGEVVEVGADVKDWKVGDRVLVDPRTARPSAASSAKRATAGWLSTARCPITTWCACPTTSASRPPSACRWPTAPPGA